MFKAGRKLPAVCLVTLMGELNDTMIVLAEKYGTTPEIVEALYYKFLDWDRVEVELAELFP